jgi:phosphoribosylformylglycinamidine cyclo-ligase
VPPVFPWLAQAGGIAEAEMLRTFNCGIGMIVFAPQDQAGTVAAHLREAGENPLTIGEAVAHAGGERVQTSGALRLSR